MLQIANGKLSEEVVVVFLSELVVPRVVVRLGEVIVVACKNLWEAPENVEFL